MKISELSADDVVRYLRLDDTGEVGNEIINIMDAAKHYIASHTGLSIKKTNDDAPCIDDHDDLTMAYLVLCQDMFDHRTMDADGAGANRTVETILGMHTRNLL